MSPTDWERYFTQNRQDRRALPWHAAGQSTSPEGPATLEVLRWLQVKLTPRVGGRANRADGRDGARPSNMPSQELFRVERDLNARMLAEVIAVIDPRSRPVVGRGGDLGVDLVAVKLLGMLQRQTGNDLVRTAAAQLVHDLGFQIRYQCEDRPATSRRWIAVTLLVTLSELSLRWPVALGLRRRELWRGALANWWDVARALAGQRAYSRGCREQLAATAEAEVVPVPRRKKMYWPQALREAPPLPESAQCGPVSPRTALLINPFYPKDPHASFGKHVLTPTLALTSVAGATPANWQVRYWDENLLQGSPPATPVPAVVGITVHLTFAQRAFALADWYRARGATVVLGGLHVVSCPEECAPHADALAVGEGTQVWPEMLRDVEAGTLRAVYTGKYQRPFREDPPPRRELLPAWGFLTKASVNATRGCHNRCGFCYLATDGLQMPYQMRDVEQVVEEIYDTGEPYAVFTDNNLGSRRDYLRRLCRVLRPLEIIWSAAVTIDVTDEPELVREMAGAGCTGVFVGFESLTGDNLTAAHKKSPRPEDYARRVRLLHDHGIQVNGSFVLGFDHDRRDCFARTAEWVEANRLECATFHILTPYPGTPLFRQMEAEGRLLHKDWNRYDTAHVVFRPRWMTPEELADGYAWCYERLFTHRSIWRRRPAEAAAVAPYLAMAYLYKRSNRFWHFLIQQRLTHAVWRPLVEITRRRHVRHRRGLVRSDALPVPAGTVLPAGV